MIFPQRNTFAALIKELPQGTERKVHGDSHGLESQAEYQEDWWEFSTMRGIWSVSVFRQLRVNTREPGIEAPLWPCLAPLPEAPALAL